MSFAFILYYFSRKQTSSHLGESCWWSGPGLVQDILGQVPAQCHEERVAHVIQEILVLRTALLVAVDEALDEPEVGKDERQVKSEHHTVGVCQLRQQYFNKNEHYLLIFTTGRQKVLMLNLNEELKNLYEVIKLLILEADVRRHWCIYNTVSVLCPLLACACIVCTCGWY